MSFPNYNQSYVLPRQPPSFTGPPSFDWFRPSSGYMDTSINQEIPRDLDHCRIPLKDIIQATNNFAEEIIIENEYNWTVYKGELSGKMLAFALVDIGYMINRRVVTLSSLPEHQNIVPFIGWCDKDGKMIIVLEHLTRGGLDKYVSGAHLTWLMRVKICLDIASGLHYLEDHRGKGEMDIGDFNSARIHLDEKWQAKIQFITPSALTDPAPPPSTALHLSGTSVAYRGQLGHLDPLYRQTGMQSELYSLGLTLFELLCGRLAVTYDEEGGTQFLSKLACNHYEKGTLSEIIDPLLRVQMNSDSIAIFSEVAYRCLNENPSINPTLSVVIEQLQKVLKLQQGFEISELRQVKDIRLMKIPLKEIRSASRDVTIPHKIGKVYKAVLSHFNGDRYVAEVKFKRVSMEESLKYPRIKSTVAIKSIDGGHGQRTKELLQTLLYVSHENLVKLVGFCDEDDGRIHVVYEYASNGSLDEYIQRQHIIKTKKNMFPWVMRLQFCLDAARGLNFLHNGNGKNDTLIHGNIKSSNILISREGVGMIGDFGLSTNQNSHRLTKEYDVFSFGLVLYEVMSKYQSTDFELSKDDLKLLPDQVKLRFNLEKLNDIIDPMLQKEFEKDRASISTREDSIYIFAKLAYRCLVEVENRPTMADIVKELEKAYEYHVDGLEKRQEDEDKSKMENLKHLKIPLKEIYSATNGFDDSRKIGWGGFGGVYSAELFHVDVRKYVGKKESLVELYGYPRRKGEVALKRREIMSDQGRKEFWKEIDVLSGLNHQNIISLVGFCYEYGEMIIIYDYASNGSFDGYLRKNQNLTWEQRLQICIDAAQGLNYLHSHHIIHRDVKSGNILLGGSLEGIIGDVGLSITINSADSQLIVNPVGTLGYIDPKYFTKGILTKQSDMYSLGVVLLEVLRGEFVKPPAKDKFRAILVEKEEQNLTSNQPSQIIGGYLEKDLKNGKFLDSVKTFAAITHECLHSTDRDETHRLTMADVLKELKKALTLHLIGVETILLEDVKSATNHFSKERVIGSGASGKIYKGELSFFKKSIPVAVKRLDRARSYGEGEFLKEVVKLCGYVHENIITLRGFCEEGNEKIIIMDHAIKGSLDKHLHESTLTWGLRLKISIGAAKGLNYIHSFGEDQKTVHGDLKSSNILLDHDWKVSICDFIVSKNHGTLGYLDPQYYSSGATKEADVYSFGVVLFELLSGRLAIDKVEKYLPIDKKDDKKSQAILRKIIEAGDGVKDKKDAGDGVKDEKDAGDGVKDKKDAGDGVKDKKDAGDGVKDEKDAGDGVKDKKDAGDGVKDEKDAGDGVKNTKVVFLAWIAARCFEDKKLEALIFDDIKKQTDAKSIDILSQVAYKCLQKDKKKRPTMALVIQELEKALNVHVDWEFEQNLPKDNENIMKMIEHRESEEITKKDLYPIFSSGILLNNGKVWLSLNKDGKAKEMISATTFSYEKCWSSKLKVLENSRFGTVAKISDTSNLKTQIKIKSQFLSLGIIYGAYLVFKFSDTTTVSSEPYVKLEYSIASEDLNSYVAVRRDDGWMMIELCRFRNHNQITEFKVQLERFWGHPCGIGPILVDGIEFRPIDNVDHEESVDRLINADLSVKWDQQLSSDFQEIMTRSQNDVPTRTKEELHKLLSTGVLIDNGEKLLSLSKVNCKKCHMLPAKAVIHKSPDAKFTKCPSSTMSRFEEVVELQPHQAFSIKCNIETKLLSPDTAYACYLVFQLPENSEGLKCPVKARDLLNKNNKESTIIYLKAPGPVDLYRDKRVPENREDGWMEVMVWKFDYNNKTKDNYIPMELKLVCLGGTMSGLIVCGVEFRPL